MIELSLQQKQGKKKPGRGRKNVWLMLRLRKREKKHLLINQLFNSSCFGFFQYPESVVLTQKVVLIVKNFNQVKLPKLRLYCL